MLTVLGLLLVGVALGNLGSLPPNAGTTLDLLLVRVAVPGLILAVVPTLEADPRLALPAVVAWLVVLGLTSLVWLVARAWRLDRRTTGTLMVVVPLGNTSFLGFPAVEALLGAELIPLAVVYDQFGSFLALTTLSTVVAARYGSSEVPTAPQVARRVLSFPPFVALLVAFALLLPLGGLPGPLLAVASTVGATVTPLAMIAVGMRLRLERGGWRPGVLTAGLTARLVLAPAVVFAVAQLDGLDDVWRVSVLESAMPPMVLGGVIATAAGLDERLSANLVGIGAIVSMVGLPAWNMLLS